MKQKAAKPAFNSAVVDQILASSSPMVRGGVLASLDEESRNNVIELARRVVKFGFCQAAVVRGLHAAGYTVVTKHVFGDVVDKVRSGAIQ